MTRQSLTGRASKETDEGTLSTRRVVEDDFYHWTIGPMIEFVTLLLGLVVGGQAVELSVSGQVALVEVRLDGKFAGGMTGPPWIVNCDFGAELAPHELVATAYDGTRRELQTIRQWVNLPRDRVEARLALDRPAQAGSDQTLSDQALSDQVTARLIWTALDHRGLPAVRVTFDGQPIPADNLVAIPLPPHDPRGIHFLRAELEFSAAEQAYAELVFGGTYADEVSTELTALVFEAGKRLPKAEQMDGWLRKGDQTLEVVAVERGTLNLLVVRERSVATSEGLSQVFKDYQAGGKKSKQVALSLPGTPDAVTPKAVLGKGDRVRFAFPTTGREQVRIGQGATALVTEQVPVSLDVTDYGPLFDQLTTGFWPEEEAPAARQQLADAVAVAGVVAATGDQRRAVLLIGSGVAEDSSRFSPGLVRGYLRRLGVPLFVWSVAVEDGAPSAWGEARDVSRYQQMNKALEDLRKALKSQVVVWVEGSHLGHEIELTDKASGLKPVS